MTRQEFSILVKAMKAVYSDPKFIADQAAFDVWYAVIGDLDYAIATQAYQAHLNSSPYPPMPVDFRQYAVRRTTPECLNEEKAWTLVTRAIRNGYYGAEEEFAKLPPDVQRALGSPVNLREMAQLPKDTVQSVEKSHFLRAYRTEVERTKEDRLMIGVETHKMIGDKND